LSHRGADDDDRDHFRSARADLLRVLSLLIAMKRISANITAVFLLFVAAGCRSSKARASAASETRSGSWSELRDSIGTHALRDDPKLCTDCITVDTAVVIGRGSDSGDAYVNGSLRVLRDSRGDYWANQDRNRIKVFDEHGRFVRLVGRPGKGPMEWAFPWPVASDANGNVHVVDIGNMRETVIGPDFRRVSEQTLPPMAINDVVSVGPGDYFVNAWGTSPERIAEPLHLVRDGKTVRSFGAHRSGEPLTQSSSRRVIAADGAGHLFSTQYFKFEIEAWTRDGQRIFGLEAPLNSTPVKPGAYNLDDNPIPNQVHSMLADNSGHLWVLTYRVKPGWRDNVEYRQLNGIKLLGPTKGHEGESSRFSRIEVVDLERRVIVARIDRPQTSLGVAGPGLLWENRRDTDGKPEIRIWRLGLRGTKPWP